MKKKILSIFVLFIFYSCKSQINDTVKASNLSNINDYINTKEVALKIAEAVWLSMYGDKIERSRPFNVTLKDNIWIIEGTLHERKGGVPYIKIQKDGKILKVTHGK
ncbi:NTF2 fold immunity protein [Chryseobacterium ureilyticum]|uniref:NTF2 fold immunity protein n=1 Tax=Chryseobacterium ureilyticum TaxID=373668 RepID=A0A1N7QJC5_9FLAO|nr:NTF2 fold immunity protein [Chryseobacterium ureilyticum]SIT22874.1 NTF2 fold immunity protein [Chryseobacterium ureilyticum]